MSVSLENINTIKFAIHNGLWYCVAKIFYSCLCGLLVTVVHTAVKITYFPCVLYKLPGRFYSTNESRQRKCAWVSGRWSSVRFSFTTITFPTAGMCALLAGFPDE